MSDKPRTVSDKQKERSEKLEAQIRESEKRKQDRIFIEELSKRITIAREGRSFIERKNFPAAMASYRRFLSITAKSFDVPVEQLTPSQFDEKRRVAESLILSSIFFDLLKILDKLNTESARDERRLYHKLFLRFTKGMPFQNFAAENIRRHLTYSNSIQNKNEFWATHKEITGKQFCIVASWAFDSDSCNEVVRLRRFRDEVLLSNPFGRKFTKTYYQHGHTVASLLAKTPGARALSRRALSTFLNFLD